ncbi:hypothetical protein SLE2022_105670 [Rubroshorea leprosula]
MVFCAPFIAQRYHMVSKSAWSLQISEFAPYINACFQYISVCAVQLGFSPLSFVQLGHDFSILIKLFVEFEEV